MTKKEHEDLVNNGEFELIGFQYTIIFMSRVHSQAEFLFSKVVMLRDKLFSNYEASEIIEAFTIKTICDWEWYVEKIICECLKDDTSQFSKQLELKLPKTVSIDECIAYLNGFGYYHAEYLDLRQLRQQRLVL